MTAREGALPRCMASDTVMLAAEVGKPCACYGAPVERLGVGDMPERGFRCTRCGHRWPMDPVR